MGFEHVHVVINPVAGQEEPVLSILNEVFQPAGLDWDVSVTKGAGDATRLARAAAEAGAQIVGAYGGDGTVSEVASGLIGTGVPLAILPGGTANAMSSELGISNDLRQASQLLLSHETLIRELDMGEINGHNFLLRAGIGFEAAMVEKADRELKDRFGNLAYMWAAVQNLIQPEIAHYHLILDGKVVEIDGLTCMIANSGNLAQRNLSLLPGIDVSDGMLDVIVVQTAGLRTLIDLIGGIAGVRQPETNQQEAADRARNTLQWWQAKEIMLVSTPSQVVQCDGEVLGRGPVKCRVLPHAVRVLTPTPATKLPANAA